MQSYIFPCNCANIFSSAILLFCCKIFRLGVCCCFIVGCVNNSNGVGNFYEKIFEKIWWIQTSCVTLHRFWQERALSSAGSERLPYKQRVGGSNPSAPTTISFLPYARALSSAGSERLPYKQRVGGSNPSAPTTISFLPYARALSSAGSERLPYKQRVGGSNPSAPTIFCRVLLDSAFLV